MATIVTLHVFSGRPDPVWTLSDAEAEGLTHRLGAGEPTATKASGVLGYLGYRGFSVHEIDARGRAERGLFAHEGIVDPGPTESSLVTGDRDLEAFLLETAGDRLEDAVHAHVRESLERPALDIGAYLERAEVRCPPCVAADAPAYDPRPWNNNPRTLNCNNCYAYANNNPTNNFAQPGYAAGHYPYPMACDKVQPAAQADGLRAVADFSTPLGKGRGWYVALVVAPGYDYHWYRQDDNGCWSHKPGSTPVRNVDNRGQPITDPRTADRGPYTDFCSFMVTRSGIKIAGPGRPGC